MWVQIPPSAPNFALVAQRIERSPAEAEVVGSNPTQRTIQMTEGQPVGLAFCVSNLFRSGTWERRRTRIQNPIVTVDGARPEEVANTDIDSFWFHQDCEVGRAT